MTGIHGLQHIQCFFSTDFADDDAVGTHTQRVDHQLANTNGASTLNVGRPRFHARHVFLP